MTSRYLLTFLFFALFTVPSLAVTSTDPLSPKTRTIEIKPVTEAVIDVLPGRAVQFIFPWVLDDDDENLPFMYTLSNDVYFNKPIVKKGQNVLAVTYKTITKKMDGEVTDLLISSHGYHFSFTLKANFKPSKHYSTIVLKLSDSERLALIDNEYKKVREQLIAEKARLESEINDRASLQALALVGGLSLKDPDSTGVKEEKAVTLPNGDKVVGYVDGYDNFGSFTNFRVELDNDSKSPVYIKDVLLGSKDNSGNKKLFPSAFLFPPKLKPGEVVKGTVSTLNFIENDDGDNFVLFSTDQGDIEVDF